MLTNLVITQDWRKAVVANEGTHHLIDDKPFYTKRFLAVLKYHAPGLAPVVDASGAYHIDFTGKPVYAERYLQTFGYYEQRAAVENDNGWFHLDEQGQRAYSDSYAWCGNFQGGFCVVKDRQSNRYYHINQAGKRIYSAEYAYVGDFREGRAVVCNTEGLQTHINHQGEPIHNRWFMGLDVYHKSIARAQDEQGWFHIDKCGLPLYTQRFKAVEPYYNNVAVVECFDGSLWTINTRGEKLNTIRDGRQPLSQELSADLIGFWKTQTIYAAVKYRLLDQLPATVEQLAAAVKLSPLACQRLLRALYELTLVEIDAAGSWRLTAKGRLLTPGTTSAMAAAALIWGESHYQAWTKLADILQSPTADAHSYFEAMAQDKFLLATYQHALSGYAQQDYPKLLSAVNWSAHHTVIDAGGGTGTLLQLLLTQFTHLQGILLEKPAVIDLVTVRLANCEYIGADIQECWPCQADAIIFARVLHDWSDEKAIALLTHAKDSLRAAGRIYVLEMVLAATTGSGGLLDLNMLVMTGGRERSLADWQQLAAAARLTISKIIALSPIVSLLELVADEQ